MKKSLFVLLGLGGMLLGDIVPKEIPSPLVLLPPEQKKIMQYDTHEERANIMKEDHKLPKRSGYTALIRRNGVRRFPSRLHGNAPTERSARSL